MDQQTIIKHIKKDELLLLLESCDPDTQEIFEIDYLPNWDDKKLWNIAPPIVALIDEKLAGIIFRNYLTISDVSNETVLYIQRTYVVPEYRRQGIFKSLIRNVWANAFELNCKHIYMFCNEEGWEAWRRLVFYSFARTRDEKYNVVFSPMLHIDPTISNKIYTDVCEAHPKIQTGFWSQAAMNFLKGTLIKYCNK